MTKFEEMELDAFSSSYTPTSMGEAARKDAKIADMSPGYPQEPKQRGTKFWGRYRHGWEMQAAAVCAQVHFLTTENRNLARQNNALRMENAELEARDRSSAVRAVADKADLPLQLQQDLTAASAGKLDALKYHAG